MPSMGTRRSTRVLRARVLRSGRRPLARSGDGKYMKSTNGDELNELNSGDGGAGANQHKEHGRHEIDDAPKQEEMGMDVDGKVVESVPEKVVHEGLVADNHVGGRWGKVYARKRKKVDSSLVESSFNNNKKRNMDSKRFGKQFYRRKKARQGELARAYDSNVGLVAPEESLDNSRCPFLAVVVDSSCSSWYLVTCFLTSVLRYMKRARISLQQLSAFVQSKTIAPIYFSHGIHFLEGPILVAERGVCIIRDACCFVPVFTVDYSAVPYCFMYLHARMQIHFAHQMCSLRPYSVGVDNKMTVSSMRIESFQAADVLVASRSDYSGKMEVSSSNAAAARLAGQNLRLRNGRNIQKRSLLKSKRGRRPSSFGARKANELLDSSTFSFRHNSNQPSPIAPRPEPRNLAHRHSTTNIKQVKSALGGLKQEVDPTSCSANILVMDSDKCYREGGAIITLEASAEKQWRLTVKRDGMDRYTIIAENFMRACSFNHFTHAAMWGTDSGWMLEFTDKQDWLIFKELHKKCSDRNAQVPVESFIPIPGVHEVSDHANNSSVFVRPASYISVKDNELSRALLRRTANYDMDFDDEEWLNKFNNGLCSEKVFHELLSAENFELVIDAFERACHCNPDYFTNETIPPVSLNLERRVVEAVHSYWIKKRKKRRSSLIRIFKLYQPRRTQIIPNSVLRKKRSFKRRGGQIGRGKQRPFFTAVAATEQDAEDQRNAVLKAEEAKAKANRSERLAILKRERAQQLTENADLATYKAAMALKIAELAESTDANNLPFQDN